MIDLEMARGCCCGMAVDGYDELCWCIYSQYSKAYLDTSIPRRYPESRQGLRITGTSRGTRHRVCVLRACISRTRFDLIVPYNGSCPSLPTNATACTVSFLLAF